MTCQISKAQNTEPAVGTVYTETVNWKNFTTVLRQNFFCPELVNNLQKMNNLCHKTM